ncbi:MAG: hypothetical protein JNN15_20515, partial [Blastocatellia bacterium]|nr:hypothetical protein [Blastocatellia bacterium]
MYKKIDLVIVTSTQDELTAILNLKEGGKEAWKSHQTREKFTYYLTDLSITNTETIFVKVIAQWTGGTTAAAITGANILNDSIPRLACMVGVCSGRVAKSVEIGDVITASQAFSRDVGKMKDKKLEPTLQVSPIQPYLQQWLQDFNQNNRDWTNDIKSQKPFSFRYQKEWLLFQLYSSELLDLIASEETTINCPNWSEVVALLESEEMVTSKVEITDKGRGQILTYRLRYRQFAAKPDRAKPEVHYGSIASGSSDVEDHNIFDELAERDRNVIALDKESAAFLQACNVKNVALPAFVIKGVADYADGHQDEASRRYAAESAAKYLFHFVKEVFPRLKQAEKEIAKWKIPAETQYFTGREEIIEQLHNELKASGKAALTQAIAGLGGVGKTQTALRYANQFREEYTHGFLIRASSHLEMLSGYRDMAKELGLYGEKDDEIINSVKLWFEREEGWLLIVDNADDPADLKELFPTKYNGHILITSRNQNIDEELEIEKTLPLPVLTEAEAIKFFLD